VTTPPHANMYAMQRLRFLWRSIRRGFPAGWGAIGQALSLLALVSLMTGLSIAGLPVLDDLALGLLIVAGMIVEGAFNNWRDGVNKLGASSLEERAFGVSPNPWPTGITRGIIELQIAARDVNRHRSAQGDRWYCDQVMSWLEAGPNILRRSGASSELVSRFSNSGNVSANGLSGRALTEACERAANSRLEFLAATLDELVEPRADNPRTDLAGVLAEQQRRGRRVRASAPISEDGTSGPIDVWEQEVRMLLEAAGREDLALRFAQRATSERWRGWVSGPWSTRTRMDRKLLLLSEFMKELGGDLDTEHVAVPGRE